MRGRWVTAGAAAMLLATAAAAQTTGAEQVYPGAFGVPHGRGDDRVYGGFGDAVPVHGGGGPLAPGAAFGATGGRRGPAELATPRGRLPSYYLTQRFRIDDWEGAGLEPPGPGLGWVDYDGEPVLVDGDGVILGVAGPGWAGPADDYDLGYRDGYDDALDGTGAPTRRAIGGSVRRIGPGAYVASSGPAATVISSTGRRAVVTATTRYEEVMDGAGGDTSGRADSADR